MIQRHGLLLVSLLVGLLGACSSYPDPYPPSVIDRVAAPPRKHVRATPTERLGTRGGLVDESASSDFLDRQIERRAADAPQQPPRETRTLWVPREYGYGDDLRDYEYDYDVRTYPVYPYTRYGYGVYGAGYSPYYRRRFPLGSTLVGAGLGAIIGHQSGNRDRGAAIGAGLGLLFGR